ncbi:MAG: hypothetical protein QOI13_3402 [Paraburkholderia sp.]|nr:hypothetical protein [Paraburkholderia sp.]
MDVIRIIGLVAFILVVGLGLLAVVDVLFREVFGGDSARKRRARASGVNNGPGHCAFSFIKLIKRRTRRPSASDRGDTNKRST